ncbi:hypothetical protein TNCV_1488251 [Trichonephila clavipes]|nr:hypothetical protein TNCV_1488251 [Trichonephila clavipes]
MPLSRMLNSTFAMPNIIDSHDMGLRTVLQSDAQNLRNLIVNSTNYDEEFVRGMLNVRIEERLEGNTSRVSENDHMNKRHHSKTFELHKLLPKFKAKEDDISLFLVLFERQAKMNRISKENWVPSATN